MGIMFKKNLLFILIIIISGSSSVNAQTIVDVRNIRPDVMILLDTSGSMEWKTSNYTYPTCRGKTTDQKNRWITAVEVLTGTFNDYGCQVDNRRDRTRIDYGYSIPHYTPLCMGLYDAASSTPYADPNCQLLDGLLDLYRERIKFGLMTFDSYSDPSTAMVGMWSYGPTRSFGNKTCNFIWNVGAKRQEVNNDHNNAHNIAEGNSGDIEGELISVGYDEDPTTGAALLNNINNMIQTEILSIKPYWGTPIAAILDDSEYYFATHPDVISIESGGYDCYYECRKRHVILFTDGMPSSDGRPECETLSNCPYGTSEEEAADLWEGSSEHGRLVSDIIVHVIAYNINEEVDTDPIGRTARQVVNAIARSGGSCCTISQSTGKAIECEVDCDPDTNANCRCALFAEDKDSLRKAFSDIFDMISTEANSHTRTATTNQITNLSIACSGNDCPVQYQFNSSFNIASGVPWEGNLERTTYICDEDLNVVASKLVNYADVLDDIQTTRYLYTIKNPPVLPRTGNSVVPDMFNETNINPVELGLATTDTTTRNETIEWMRGDDGTLREDRRLGAIYHSNPVVLGPPNDDIPLMSYYAGPHKSRGNLKVNSFKAEYKDRPNVIYINTLDGILHAFEVEGNTPLHPRELWGYVPNMLMETLPENLTGNQFLLDGINIVEDRRTWKGGEEGSVDEWMTVLVSGLRQGGGVRGYFALDVTEVRNAQTNPADPKFRVLWEITHETSGFERLGLTYGGPLFGTVFMNDTDHTNSLGEVGVVLLPGGFWPEDDGNDVGNAFYIVKADNGRLIKTFTAPVGYDVQFVGTPFGYSILNGSVTTRVFVGDNKGHIWRIDLSSTNPDDWKIELFYDFELSQPIYMAPAAALTNQGQLIIISGTGDPDNLATRQRNKIVSLTEEYVYTSTGTLDKIQSKVNWELIFGVTTIDNTTVGEEGERITGEPVIFDGTAYFSTFVPHEDPNNCCTFGYGRIWGVHFTGHDDEETTDVEPMFRVDPDDPESELVPYIDLLNREGERENTITFGIDIVRRPSCAEEETVTDENGIPRPRLVNCQQPQYEMIAQINSTGDQEQIEGQQRQTQLLTRTLPAPNTTAIADSWASIFGY